MAVLKVEADLLPRIRKLDVYARQTVLSEVIEGNWTASFKGHGMEFSGYRSYNYGDDASLIDWKASLRSKSLLIKEYEEEKSVNVYFLLDVSNSMLFTSTKKLKSEYAAELVSSLAYAVIKSGDAVGMSMFTDRQTVKLPVNLGRKMHYFIVKELADPKNYGGEYNLGLTLKQILSTMKTKAVIIIVSDFIGLDKDWYKYLKIASQQYQIIGIMVRDPRDRELPKSAGQYVLEDPYTHEKLYVDTAQYAEEYRKLVEKEEADIEKHFKATKSDFLRLSTDKEFYQPIVTFFKRRALIRRS